MMKAVDKSLDSRPCVHRKIATARTFKYPDALCDRSYARHPDYVHQSCIHSLRLLTMVLPQCMTHGPGTGPTILAWLRLASPGDSASFQIQHLS